MRNEFRLVSVLSVLTLLLAACQPAAPAAQPTSAPAAAAPAAAPAKDATAAAPAAKPPAAPAAPAAPAPAAGSSGPTRVFVGSNDPLDSQNPYAHSNTFLYPLFCEVLGCLVGWDAAKAEPIPSLAESWKVENPTTWVFNLRKGVKWQDGSPFTSADVVNSLNRVLSDPQSRQKDRMSNVAKFEAVDDFTVRVTSKEPDAELLDAVFITGIAMTSKAQLDRGDDLNQVLATGTGPYMLKEWKRGERVVLAKNPSWWGGPVQGPDEVVSRSIREDAARMTALLNNEVQLAMNVPPQDVERINGNSNTKVMIGDSLTNIFIGMNLAFKPWDNKNLRQAVCYGVDRDALIKGVLQGYAERLDGPIGPGQYGYNPNLQPKYTFDQAKAKELVAQAGFPSGVDVDFTTSVGSYTKDKEVSEAILAMLNPIGIRGKLLTPEAATRTNMLFDGKLSFFYQGRGQVRDPGKPLSQYFETGVTKRIGYSNPTVDELFKKERAAFDPNERKKLLSDLMSQIVEDAPACFLWRYKLLWGVSKSIEWAPRADEAVLANEIRVK